MYSKPELKQLKNGSAGARQKRAQLDAHGRSISGLAGNISACR